MNKKYSNMIYSFKLLFGCSHAYIIWKIFIAIYRGTLNTVNLIMLRRIINNISSGFGYYNSIICLLVFCLTIIMCQCVIYFVEAKAEPSFSYKLKKHISIKMFEKAISVDISCYEDKTYYDKYCVAMTHAYERCNEELDALTRLIEAVTTFIVSGMLSLLINPIIIVFAFLPFSTLVFRNKKNSIVHTTNQKISDINRKKEYVMRTFYQDIYAKEMRTTSIHRPLLERFLNASREIKEVYKKDGVRATWIWIVESFLNMAFSEYLVLIYAAWETLVKKTMRYGDCLVIVSAMQSIYDATNEILECVSKLHEHSLYINDLRAFLKYESKEGQDSCAIEASCGDIIFKNVSFRYKNCDKNVLCDVNLHIKKGEKVALVGDGVIIGLS